MPEVIDPLRVLQPRGCKYCYGTENQGGFHLGPRIGRATWPCLHCWYSWYGKKSQEERRNANIQNPTGRERAAPGPDGRAWHHSGETDIGLDYDAGRTIGPTMAPSLGFCPACGTRTTDEKCKLMCRNSACELFGQVIENCSSD